MYTAFAWVLGWCAMCDNACMLHVKTLIIVGVQVPARPCTLRHFQVATGKVRQGYVCLRMTTADYY